MLLSVVVATRESFRWIGVSTAVRPCWRWISMVLVGANLVNRERNGVVMDDGAIGIRNQGTLCRDDRYATPIGFVASPRRDFT